MAITNGDLVGTKNGSNAAFTIPVVAITNSVWVIFNGSVLYHVGSFSAGSARNGECIVSGQNVTVGLPPNPNDKLHYYCDV